METPELIAYLDAYERQLQGMIQVTRELRHMLFEEYEKTLDNDPDAVVD